MSIKYITIPYACPICGEPTEIRKDGIAEVLYCTNEYCDARISNKLVHFCSKKAMDIKGLSEKTIDKLIDKGWLNSAIDLYSLKDYRNDWIKMDGFGEASVDKILNAIEETRSFPLTKFITAIGIKEIGTSAAKALEKKFKTWENFRAATEKDILALDGFGDIMLENIMGFDYAEADEIIEKYRITPVEEKDNDNVAIGTSLEGVKICVTGKLHYFKNRDALIAAVEAAGGSVTSAVSAKTNYLVNNDIDSASSKNVKAKSLGIPIITEDKLVEMLGT